MQSRTDHRHSSLLSQQGLNLPRCDLAASHYHDFLLLILIMTGYMLASLLSFPRKIFALRL